MTAIAVAVAVVVAGLAAARALRPRDGAAVPDDAAPAKGFVGSASCRECHRYWHKRWSGSHHDRAMQRATPAALAGDFAAPPLEFAGETTAFRREGEASFLTTEGPDGRARELPVAFTFGVWPLQQVLVPGERGRYHAPLVAWDARAAAAGGQRWFRLRPEDGRIPPTDLYHSFGPYQRWNSMCAECHSTGVRKRWDAAGDRYATTWVEDGVGCEACHGPGEAHVAHERGKDAAGAGPVPPRYGLAVELKEHRPLGWHLDAARGIWMRTPVGRPAEHYDVCARCHSRRGTIAEADVGAPLHDTHRVALLDEGLYFADGQVREEVFEHGSYLQSKMYAIGVGCFDCHDHKARAPTDGAAAACANCHLPEKFATPAHHHHTPGKPGAGCVDCHMPTRTYMVVHARRDHAIRIPRPDLSVTLGTPNACNGCHAEKDAAWAAERTAAWWPAVPTRPHWGTALDAGRRGAPGAAAALAALVRDAKTPAIVRGTAASLLARNPSPDVERTVAVAASDVDPLVRRGAVEGAAVLAPDARWRVLGPLLADPTRVVRIDAARRLVGTDTPTPADGDRLAAGVREARAAAAWAADTPEGGMALGDLETAVGDLAAAERAYRAVIASAAAFVPAHVNLADVLRQAGREGEATAVLEAAVRTWPEAAAAHHALGLAYVRARRLADAGTHLEKAATLAPRVADFAVAWAAWLADTGSPRRAVDVVAAASAAQPYDPDLLAAWASLAAQAGDRAGALKALYRLEALRPWDDRWRAEREAVERAGPR
ncbi:MAG: multiheme c-type cytochrome [Planctomycetota bacterium]